MVTLSTNAQDWVFYRRRDSGSIVRTPSPLIPASPTGQDLYGIALLFLRFNLKTGDTTQ